MTGNVVSLHDVREKRQRWWQGPCVCIGCRHEWEGDGPIGEMFISCPECQLPKGHPKHPFRADTGDVFFSCSCGCEAMTAYCRGGRFEMICMRCGTNQTDAIYGAPV